MARLILLLSFFSLASCTATIHPPAAVVEPSTVILFTHGISSSLVLADEPGRAVRFAYGDWDYYALNKDSAWNAMAALFWPTPSGLGRQVIEGAANDPPALIRQFGIGYDEVFLFDVERDAVTRLRTRLESFFGEALDNPEVRLEFVPHPDRYSIFNHSNMAIVRWLRELGARVPAMPLLPRYRAGD
ncbi:MAG TPA: hypothetical protein VNA04_05240 [Thermoanaerobaculia bacterium]|nr:hypothetical protein [Thermoanaerobaculia bacterium]